MVKMINVINGQWTPFDLFKFILLSKEAEGGGDLLFEEDTLVNKGSREH